ncbi:MAG: ribosome maturation factor RimP [Clostridiales Family XIII bacterium]|nr:ribosome maturation factor RimP [Clostridiales Family XIII bacterium]
MAKKNTIGIVREILADFLPRNGYELWNAEFAKEGKDYNLKVYIDAKDGVGADDCEKVSRYLSEKLDEADPIDMPYYLIVSSPGMDRPLLTQEHFERYRGSHVDVALYKGVNGKKAYSGILCERTEDDLIIRAVVDDADDSQGEEIKFPLALVSKVRLQVIF